MIHLFFFGGGLISSLFLFLGGIFSLLIFVSENSREFYASRFQGQILVWAYAICWLGKLLISFTVPCVSPFLPCHTESCIPLVSVCFICLVWFGLWHIDHWWLINAKPCFYIYTKYVIWNHIVDTHSWIIKQFILALVIYLYCLNVKQF